VPRDRKVQRILDARDEPASLVGSTASWQPSWRLQIFGGASVIADAAVAQGLQMPRDCKLPWHIFVVTLLEHCQERRLHHD